MIEERVKCDLPEVSFDELIELMIAETWKMLNKARHCFFLPLHGHAKALRLRIRTIEFFFSCIVICANAKHPERKRSCIIRNPPGKCVLRVLEPRARLGAEFGCYIISGCGVMTLDGREHKVTTGDIAAVFPGGSHGLANHSDGDLRVIVVCVAGGAS